MRDEDIIRKRERKRAKEPCVDGVDYKNCTRSRRRGSCSFCLHPPSTTETAAAAAVCVVLFCRNAIVWELVISAEDSYYIIMLYVRGFIIII